VRKAGKSIGTSELNMFMGL